MANDSGGGGGGNLQPAIDEARNFNASVAQAIADIGNAIALLESMKSSAITAINRARDEALKAIHSAAPQHSWGADNPAFQTPERLADPSAATGSSNRGQGGFTISPD